MLCHKTHSLASAICGLNTGSEKKGFGADVAALISARNDFHHGRGPLTDEEIAIASKDAQERLQRCMEALSFLTQYPIRLVQDFDLDRRSGQLWLKCLRLTDDGPGFTQERAYTFLQTSSTSSRRGCWRRVGSPSATPRSFIVSARPSSLRLAAVR